MKLCGKKARDESNYNSGVDGIDLIIVFYKPSYLDLSIEKSNLFLNSLALGLKATFFDKLQIGSALIKGKISLDKF